jgi:hypothetical protein
VHKGRRWWLNIKIKERPFAEGSSDCKFYKPLKIMVLTCFELSLLPSYASWMVKVNARTFMSICLTNYKLKTLCPMKYEYPNFMLLELKSQASSCHCKYTRIIENRQRGTSLPDDMEQAHIKMTGQTDNEHLDISFIYLWYSFLFWDASSNVHYGHVLNFHHEWRMA